MQRTTLYFKVMTYAFCEHSKVILVDSLMLLFAKSYIYYVRKRSSDGWIDRSPFGLTSFFVRLFAFNTYSSVRRVEQTNLYPRVLSRFASGGWGHINPTQFQPKTVFLIIHSCAKKVSNLSIRGSEAKRVKISLVGVDWKIVCLN